MLNIDWVTILAEIINFVIVTIALYYLVFKPIVKRSQQRAQEKAQLMSELAHDRAEAAARLAEIETRLRNFDVELQQIADDAYEKNKALQKNLLEKTYEEANQILQDALLEVRKEQNVGLIRHQGQLVNTILNITAETLRKVMPQDIHDSMLEDLNVKIWDLGKTNMQQVQNIRDSFTDRLPAAYVKIAMPLNHEQERRLVRTFSALVDTDVDIDIEVDENLIAGVEVRLGDLVIENSLSSQLRAIRTEIEESLDHANLNIDG